MLHRILCEVETGLRRENDVISQEWDILKSHQHLLGSGPVTSGPLTSKMRYHFIQEHNGQFHNSVMFGVPDVRASAFYQVEKAAHQPAPAAKGRLSGPHQRTPR